MLLSKGCFYQAWVGPSAVCLLPSYPAILNVQSSLCSKSMKPSVWSPRFSSPWPTSRQRPLGSEFVHSHYTPTWFFKILKLLLELWRLHLQPSGIVGFLKMDTIHVYLWFWDVDPLCIARGYTLYSYMTWIWSVFYWHPWFISSQAWVCPPQWDNYYFCRWHLPNSSLGLTRFICWWRFVMYFGHQILLTSHIRGHIL